MKSSILKYTSILLGLGMIYSSAAQAISFAYSEKTKKTAVIFDINGGSNLPFNFNVKAGVELMPFYSDIVGSNSFSSGLSNDFMGNGYLNLGYNFKLLDSETILGKFDPTITPFVGYKHFFAYTPSVTLSNLTNPSQSLSNTGGVNFGLRLSSNLPLGFFVFAEGGATSMMNGSWTTWAGNETPANGTITSNGLLLPNLSVGASWSLMNLVTLRAGYKMLFIPDIRTPNAPLTDVSKTAVNSLDVGISILFFSI